MFDDPAPLLCWWRSWRRLPVPPTPHPPPRILCFFHLLLFFSSPSLLFSPCVFLQRHPAFKRHTPFLPTGPSPQAHKESEQQVSLIVNSWLYDFLFDLSSSFPCFISEWGLPACIVGSWAVASAETEETRILLSRPKICCSIWKMWTLKRIACNASNYLLVNVAVYRSKLLVARKFWKGICFSWLELLSTFFFQNLELITAVLHWLKLCTILFFSSFVCHSVLFVSMLFIERFSKISLVIYSYIYIQHTHTHFV